MLMIPLQHRNQLSHIYRERGYRLGAEIGVEFGEYALALLGQWSGRLLLVDCWQHQPPEEYRDPICNRTDDEHEWVFRKFLEKTQKLGDRVAIWRMFSPEAAACVPDGALDFVYIDGNHNQPAVAQDLAAWWPKVRPGGILAGHDYFDPPTDMFGVKPAVDQFAATLQLPVQIIPGEYPLWAPSWVIESR